MSRGMHPRITEEEGKRSRAGEVCRERRVCCDMFAFAVQGSGYRWAGDGSSELDWDARAATSRDSIMTNPYAEKSMKER